MHVQIVSLCFHTSTHLASILCNTALLYYAPTRFLLLHACLCCASEEEPDKRVNFNAYVQSYARERPVALTMVIMVSFNRQGQICLWLLLIS
jgi:hypothetical protein